VAVRRRSRTSADPFDSRIVIATQAQQASDKERNRHLVEGAGGNGAGSDNGKDGKEGLDAPRRRRGADPSIGFSGYDTLSSDEEWGELPWRADVDGFGVSDYATTKAQAGAAIEGQLGSVFGHGGGYGALGGGGEAAAAQKAVRVYIDRDRGGCCCCSCMCL